MKCSVAFGYGYYDAVLKTRLINTAFRTMTVLGVEGLACFYLEIPEYIYCHEMSPVLRARPQPILRSFLFLGSKV
jgi:hypothetical protein